MRSSMLRVLFSCRTSLQMRGWGAAFSHNRSTGAATFHIVWPRPSRLIPAASASVKIEVALNSKTIATKVVPRPAAGGTATVKIDGLPAETVTNTITAFPNADGTGVAQATGTAPLKSWTTIPRPSL